jgi:hypothetical protein
MDPRKVLRIFNGPVFDYYYYSLGRGKPKTRPEAIWFTYRGKILGQLPIVAIIQNDGTLPPLWSVENPEKRWEFRPGVWIAIAHPPMKRLHGTYYYAGFRGWRYFDFEVYRKSLDARMCV